MGRYLAKIILFLAPLAAAAGWIAWTALGMRAEPFYNELERKLDHAESRRPRADVIIAGDSRAEHQVIPGLLDSLTGLRSVNVGTPSCDLVTLVKALAKRGLLDEDRILVISVSPFQINDGALDPGYLSMAALTEMAPADLVRVFRHDPDKALPAFRELAGRALQAAFARRGIGLRSGRPEAGLPDGYEPLEGKRAETLAYALDPSRIKHTWYKHLDDGGVRLRIFREALGRLGRSRARILIYHAGMSPGWRAYTRGSFIERAERNFSRILREEAARYPNMRFVDFYGAYADRFPEALFYDSGHLNDAGAGLFTRSLAGELGKGDWARSAQGRENWSRAAPSMLSANVHEAETDHHP